MKTFILFLFLFPSITFAQKNKQLNFISDYQYNGNVSHHKLVISFSDPKLITKEGTEFKNRPKGYLAYQFEGLKQSMEQIIFVTNYNSETDIYAVINSESGYDIMYVIKSTHKIGNKTYGFTIILGTIGKSNIGEGELPEYFDAIHCNLTK